MTGILLIDKPAGWTSSDVVAKLRGILHEKRIGHSGTLDPMATGLLVIFIGRATRAVEFAEAHDKRYRAALRLGLVTDTQDSTGTVLSQCSPFVSREKLEAVFPQFRGNIMQVPPMYSAIKVKGQKLYEIARRGGEVERQPRNINISRLEVLGQENEDWILDVVCSKGTYIRTLCHDIGQALGCGGCMSALRRLEAGHFNLDDAYTLQQVQAAADEGTAESLLLPTDCIFLDLPKLVISPNAEKKLRNGGSFRSDSAEGCYRLYNGAGTFLAIGHIQGGEGRVIKSFFEV